MLQLLMSGQTSTFGIRRDLLYQVNVGTHTFEGGTITTQGLFAGPSLHVSFNEPQDCPSKPAGEVR
jgi:hypothetical protein